MDTPSERDRSLEAAQTALLARHAPGTRSRRVRWSRGETQVLELGAGSPLLLVHGALGDGFAWVPILSPLARMHRVLVVDLPGHGLADPFDYSRVDLLVLARTFLREVLDSLKLRAVDVVGSSVGGLWSVAFAIEAPDRVARLVLVGAPAGIKRPGMPPQLRLLCLPLIGQSFARLFMSKPTRDSNRKFWGQVLVVHPERIEDALLDATVASQRRNFRSHLGVLRCLGDAGGLRRSVILGERWRDLKVPTLFLWGERDTFLPPEEGEAIVVQNSNRHMIRIPEAGHLPWIDNSERVVGEIERFLAV
jgi:pimeloyl-ACP methyl ester carboxylesterase